MTLTVHHLEQSRSHRILWLLEELGVPYELKIYRRDPVTRLAPPELKKIHPLGKSPVVTDDNVVLAESGAIVEYLVSKYSSAATLAPPVDSRERIEYSFWLHYAEGSLMMPLILGLVMRVVPSKVPFLVRPIARAICGGVTNAFVNPQLKTHLEFINEALAKAPYFAGAEFTAADIQMSYPLIAALSHIDAALYPNIHKFVAVLKERPAFQRALAKGGPIELQ